MQWDETIFSRMSEKARLETEGARAWLEANQGLSDGFMNSTNERHPALWVGAVFQSALNAAEQLNTTAIEFGCQYLIQDPKVPFGRIYKQKFMNTLRRNSSLIPLPLIPDLLAAYARMGSLEFIPQEYRDFGRLIRALVPPNHSMQPTVPLRGPAPDFES